ncbi:MAG: ATP-dependent RecD-like DNA helicase [Ruminococcus sp.]|jgi:exodeoxyribonuclease V alpha subunit|nr:ATP-dependent RecD-like DNA helicase [Ruminococcus sp.]
MFFNPSEPETVRGYVSNIIYANEETGYCVFDFETDTDDIKVESKIGVFNEGDELTIDGVFSEDVKYGGEKFSAYKISRAKPKDKAAIIKYFSSSNFAGIGKKLAERLVAAFGTDIFTVIENEPGRLAEVEGITKKKALAICETYEKMYGLEMLYLFLNTYEISAAKAAKVWKKYGRSSSDIIKSNPYVLYEEGIDLPFSKCDEVAGRLGIAEDDPNRITAGIYHSLTKSGADTCLPEDELLRIAAFLLRLDREAVALTIKSNPDLFEYFDKSGVPYVAAAKYAKAESYIAARLAVSAKSITDFDYDKLIEIEEAAKAITYAKKQKEAIGLALTRGVFVLTGGPGTGKTTTLKAVISLYKQRGMKVMVAAPTGKAAKRISELTGYDAKTIHRLLEVKFGADDSAVFVHNENSKLDCDVLVVDEMSMTDVLLFESLLRALRIDTRLILVGDNDQLPSVGAGNVLGDIIASGTVPVVALTEIFRQAQTSKIVTNAHKIVKGEHPDLGRDNSSDFFFIQRFDMKEAAEIVADLVARRLPTAYGFSPTDDIQVLCPSKKGLLGTAELNKRLQAKLNPKRNGAAEITLKVGSTAVVFREGDKVMQTQNAYNLLWKKDSEEGMGIYNGEIGTIIKIDENKSAEVDFDGKIADLTITEMRQLIHAYACTVHKSQGSEFEAVIIPVLGIYDKLCNRSLLYTAVTRAKKLLVIVGSQNKVNDMVDNNLIDSRFTTLRERLAESFTEMSV